MSKHPMQPVEFDKYGTIRFKENKIVRFLYDTSKNKLNELSCMDFSDEDMNQLAQLMGGSICYYGECDYVSDEDYYRAEKLAENIRQKGDPISDSIKLSKIYE